MALEDLSPTYILEHLATFTVSPENDLVYPADGMRRLLAMEKTNGIWTQKMLMRIDRNMVNIIDQENKEVVERFPLHLIREPTAFTSNDPKEMYNNILIYVAGHPSEEDEEDEERSSPATTMTPAEMHIFQCTNVRARDVVEDIKSFTAGRGPTKHYDRGRRRRQSSSSYETRDGGGVGGGGGSVGGGGKLVDSKRSPADYDDSDSSVSSEKYEMDVTVLNKCFDDIEKFIARLQNAASAFQELEKRRRGRKSKKKDMGDGMLNIRARPPPESDFIDVFQKFKLSFNLLAKLKAHIHDPNAPELVHFLFTPLALIVDASHDSHYGPNLPSKVVSPLLSGEAVDLLVNCLTSKESELWHSLGETWYLPGEDWKEFVPPFAPVFADGWRPSPPVSGGGDYHRDGPQPHGAGGGSSQNYYGEDVPDGGRRGGGRAFREELGRPRSDDEASYEDGGRAEQREWVESMVNRGIRVVRVTYPRTANNEKELSVVRGEFLELLDDSRKWWRARNGEGVVGHVPHTIVAAYDPAGRERRSSSRKAELRYF